MKRTLHLLLSVLGFTTLIAYAVTPSPIVFQITSQQFEPGDSIIIQEVLATSPALRVGDTIIVRGQYHLTSRAEASLGFFLTTKGPSGSTRVSSEQRAVIRAGSGTFELKHVVPSEGRLHVSFYPRPSGSSFGGVYFGPAVP
jgi:hypothetical protein